MGVWTQELTLGRLMLYHLSHSTSIFWRFILMPFSFRRKRRLFHMLTSPCCLAWTSKTYFSFLLCCSYTLVFHKVFVFAWKTMKQPLSVHIFTMELNIFYLQYGAKHTCLHSLFYCRSSLDKIMSILETSNSGYKIIVELMYMLENAGEIMSCMVISFIIKNQVLKFWVK
jgi:hypothetical protein